MVNPWKQDRKDKLDELRSLLKTCGELRFGDLKKKLNGGEGVSDPTLSELTEILEKNGEIEHFSKIEDRRETWYRIKPESMESVQMRLLRYDAVKFLDSIEDPQVYCIKNKDGNVSVSLFLSNCGSGTGVMKRILDDSSQRWMKAWLNYAEKKGLLKVPKNLENAKIAVVLTKEK